MSGLFNTRALACTDLGSNAPCLLASILKPLPLMTTICSTRFPAAPATVTSTASTMTVTTTVATNTFPLTVTTSDLFLTQTTVDITQTFDDGTTTIIVPPTTLIPSTTTLSSIAIQSTDTTVTVTVTQAAPAAFRARARGHITEHVKAGANNQSDSNLPALPRAVSTCKGNVISPGCGLRTCTTKCGIDRPYGDYSTFIAGGFDACSQACAQDTRCSVAAYQASTGRCWLKDTVKPAEFNRGRDLIECSIKPSAVLSTVLASDTSLLSSACGCLQSRKTTTVTTTPTQTVSATVTVSSQVTAVRTSFQTATRIVPTHIGSTTTLTVTETPPVSTMTVVVSTVFTTNTVTETVTVAPPAPTLGPELIQNGDFEIGEDYYDAPPWLIASEGLSDVEINEHNSYTGSRFLFIEGFASRGSGLSGSASQDLSAVLDFSRTYTLNFWYRRMYTSTRTGDLCPLMIQIGDVIVYSDKSAKYNSQYVFSGDITVFTPTASSATLNVYFDCSKAAQNPDNSIYSYVFFDDFSLKERLDA